MPGTCGSWEGNNQSLFPPPPHYPPQGGSRESCKECRLQGMNPPSPPPFLRLQAPTRFCKMKTRLYVRWAVGGPWLLSDHRILSIP